MENNICNSALERIVINENATKEEIVDILVSSLENLSEIKLNEGKKEESTAIKKFIEECESSEENILDTVAQRIIDGLGEKERSYNMGLYAELEQQGMKDEPIIDMQLDLIGHGYMSSLTQVTNVRAHSNTKIMVI